MTHKAHTKSITLAALAAVMVLVSSPAFADRYHRDYKYDYNHHYDDYRYDRHNHYYYNPYYWHSNYGQYKKAQRYRIGQPLPRHVAYHSVPRDVQRHLRPAPRGTRYVMVDRDVLLINAATKNVLDAIALFSAVNRR